MLLLELLERNTIAKAEPEESSLLDLMPETQASDDIPQIGEEQKLEFEAGDKKQKL